MVLNMKQSGYLRAGSEPLCYEPGVGILVLLWKVALTTTNIQILVIFNVYFLYILVLVSSLCRLSLLMEQMPT